jgi:hypothetical protein
MASLTYISLPETPPVGHESALHRQSEGHMTTILSCFRSELGRENAAFHYPFFYFVLFMRMEE